MVRREFVFHPLVPVEVPDPRESLVVGQADRDGNPAPREAE